MRYSTFTGLTFPRRPNRRQQSSPSDLDVSRGTGKVQERGPSGRSACRMGGALEVFTRAARPRDEAA